MNPFSPEAKVCPYPYYDRVREQQPVQWNDETEAWLVTSYAEALAVLRDHITFSSKNSVFGGPEIEHPEFPSMINTDEPKHKQLRNLAAKAFTPKSLDEWAPRIRELTVAMLDRVTEKDTFDLIGDLAFPLPVTMIAEIVGVESDKFAQFKTWSDDIATVIGRIGGDYEEGEGVTIERPEDFIETPIGGLFGYFIEAVADRRRAPRDDLVTRLVGAEIDGERLTDMEVISFLILLLVAGNETTTNLIGTAIKVMATQEGLMEQLRANPEQIDPMIEEALRWDAPIQSFYRRATVDARLGGQEIKAGDALLVLYGAANRDPREFGCPAEFDLGRKRRDHLAFGIGNHYCLGANLARLEARIAIEEVLNRFDSLEPVKGFTVEWRDTPFFRGMVEYPLHYTRRS